MMKGIDYAFGAHPAAAAVKAAGYGFVGRYISPSIANDSNGKNLLPAELAELHAAGLAVILFAESAAGRMKAGRAAGVADAQHAQAVTAALGMHDAPVYFACDFDAAESDQPAINAYLDGTASVIGLARNGMYGGYYPLQRAFNAGKITYGCQTLAWSGGQWDPRAHVRQHGSVRVGGITVDYDEAMTADFGQWPRPAAHPVVPPPPPGTRYPAPASVQARPHPLLAITWAASDSPHWRVQVAADDGGKPGQVIDGGQEVVTVPHVTITPPRPGRYWYRVQAAGDSPFTSWQAVTV
jgi:hypothetical protein